MCQRKHAVGDKRGINDVAEPDARLQTQSSLNEETGAPHAFRVFGFCLVGIVVGALLVMLLAALALKGMLAWSLAFNHAGTWLAVGLAAPLTPSLTSLLLSRRAQHLSYTERASMVVVSRAVAVIFAIVGILAIANT